jgi:1-acyl-sn-glycerol-3-phosphate acyltransferase
MFRLVYVLVVFFTTALPFLGALWMLDRLKLPGRWPMTLRYCRLLCGLLRVRVRVTGSPASQQPTLILGNHVSWLDIVVLSTIRPFAFVAKREVGTWPLVGMAARHLGTVFVDRTRRQDTAEVNAEIARRLAGGDPVILFAEGTSSDGNRVLEFRSALIGALAQVGAARPVLLQPMSIGYTRNQGLPMGRQHRPLVAWYGDLDFTPHFKEFVRRGVVDVTVTFGAAVPFDEGADRKALARTLETTVRRLTAATLRERALPESIPFESTPTPSPFVPAQAGTQGPRRQVGVRDSGSPLARGRTGRELIDPIGSKSAVAKHRSVM